MAKGLDVTAKELNITAKGLYKIDEVTAKVLFPTVGEVTIGVTVGEVTVSEETTEGGEETIGERNNRRMLRNNKEITAKNL